MLELRGRTGTELRGGRQRVEGVQRAQARCPLQVLLVTRIQVCSQETTGAVNRRELAKLLGRAASRNDKHNAEFQILCTLVVDCVSWARWL